MAEQEIIDARRSALASLQQQGWHYKNDFSRDTLSDELHQRYGDSDPPAGVECSLAGRMVSRRVMGKTVFADLRDMSGRIQLYLQKDALPEDLFSAFISWDIGDIVGVRGEVFRTRKGELSVRVSTIFLLSKCLRPLPEKYHGLTDREERYRQRHLDLIANADARKVFSLRSKLLHFVRGFLQQRGYVEVETPMMQRIPGGATARPFVTKHNALDMELYLRIAPELYLKRLLIGGIEKVFELNRCFRNEGLSVRHNPEFTMLEFYAAYLRYTDLMELTEQLVCEAATELLGKATLPYGDDEIVLQRPFASYRLREALLAHNPTLGEADFASLDKLRAYAASVEAAVANDAGIGAVEYAIFEKTVESKLIEPTFITHYPREVSPLALSCPDQPDITERFEFFIGGRELANGFSELNDPVEQARRFDLQCKKHDSGDDEAMRYDAEFITAMEYGMPPAAGEGIGIDRLVMALSGVSSIREVILFPHLRPRSGGD
ncbi:MAG: lysine--tRNA ligase [Candidatus Porifericomitaceae bacterium WSBS_2022_MAG_OTU9]